MNIEYVQIPQRIEVNSEAFDVITYRRDYYTCRRGCGRTGTLILSAVDIPFTFGLHSRHPETENVRRLVICESCGKRWVPSPGPALRALRR